MGTAQGAGVVQRWRSFDSAAGGTYTVTMPRDELKKRIEALNRRPLKNVPKPDSSEIKGLRRKLQKQASTASPKPVSSIPECIAYSRTVPVSTAAKRSARGRDFGPAVVLEDEIEGTVAEGAGASGYYLIERSADTLEAEAVHVHRRFVSLTGHPDGQAVQRIAETTERERVAPDKFLFLDLETTGLGGTPVFLVGTMECDEAGFRFRQYFARDYSEEAGIVAAASERLKDTQVLVTFNGKSFDLPYLANRAVATGVKMNHARSHLDLLHEARRLYKTELPNCRLQTLEATICGRSRDDDIPGSEIPEAYHEFVRTGNANKIAVILMHNLYDLLTMADLMSRMWWRE